LVKACCWPKVVAIAADVAVPEIVLSGELVVNINLKSACLAFLIGASGATHAGVSTCPSEHSNRAIADAYSATLADGVSRADTEQIAGLYADAALLMPPSEETLIGQQAIAEYLVETATPGRDQRYELELISCESRGEAVHVAGIWGLPGGDGGGRGTWQTGNLLRVLERATDGRWVSTYEIWN
jgi:ketosteroid isomerase-like protein